jgi:phosphoribosylformylglycinamidine cyclo-ligase
MSVNDVLVQGAEPLFFLDYYACGRLDTRVAAQVVKGIARGCELAGCALIGGETAEMPGMYPEGEYDLAGFCVGVVERRKIIDGRAIRPGDVLIGLASSGAHSNGYSLIRKIVERARPDAAMLEALMAPTRIYVKSILRLLAAVPVKGLAHITGGGLVGNVPRMLPAGTHAVIHAARWPRPALFGWLQAQGGVAEDEMHRVFNCGIGMVLAVAPANVGRTLVRLKRLGEVAYEIGAIEKGRGEPAARVI